jgi:NDP-sugar pyrophosphorylase family protein
VINLAHLGEKIAATLGDGSALGVRITYSREQSAGAGGIALPLRR